MTLQEILGENPSQASVVEAIKKLPFAPDGQYLEYNPRRGKSRLALEPQFFDDNELGYFADCLMFLEEGEHLLISRQDITSQAQILVLLETCEVFQLDWNWGHVEAGSFRLKKEVKAGV